MTVTNLSQIARQMIWRDFDGGPPQSLAELERLEAVYIERVKEELAASLQRGGTHRQTARR